MRLSLLLSLSAALGLSAAAAFVAPNLEAAATTHRADILPLKDVRKGMKGFGLTVFEGEKPERFGVTVIDVLRNFRPHQDLILVDTDHPRLDVAKIVAGMSGSPIYLDGKMAGAYAYGWSFGLEPIAGVTPIESMLSELDRPLPKLLRGIPLAALPSAESERSGSRLLFAGAPGPYDVEQHASQLSRRRSDKLGQGTRVEPIATPLLLSGMGEAGRQAAERLLSPLGFEVMDTGGGSAGPLARSKLPFVDGGAIGVELISGDMSAMGIGTVTRVEGDRLVAFGHPMMEIGVTSLPTSQARVLWFLASQQRSFKIGEGVGTRGALVNDRQAAIVVDQQAEARTVPVRLVVRGEPGAPHTTWNFRVAHDPFLTPALLGMAVGSGIQTTAVERREVTFTMTSKVKLKGFPEVSVVDFGAGPNGTPDQGQIMQSNLLANVGAIFSNPWQDVELLSVEVEANLSFGREVAILRAAEAVHPEIRAGEPATLRLWLEPHNQKVRPLLVKVAIPPQLKGQNVKIQVQPGYAVPRIKPAPESLAEMLSNIPDPTYDPRSLVFSFETGEGGVAFRGQVLEDLPPAALDRLGTTSESLAPLEFRAATHQVQGMPYFVVGTQTVDVRVKQEP